MGQSASRLFPMSICSDPWKMPLSNRSELQCGNLTLLDRQKKILLVQAPYNGEVQAPRRAMTSFRLKVIRGRLEYLVAGS